MAPPRIDLDRPPYAEARLGAGEALDELRLREAQLAVDDDELGFAVVEDEGDRGGVEVARVEEGDDEYSAEIVDDRQRQKEHDERGRHPATDQREDADGEGDVGRHGDAPPVGAGPARVEQRVEDRGDDHAADRGDDRESGGPWVAEIAADQLGKIQLADNWSFVAVSHAAQKTALRKLGEGKLKGRSVRVRLLT